MSDLKEDQYIIGMNSFTNAAKMSISRGEEGPTPLYLCPLTEHYEPDRIHSAPR